MAFGLSEGWPVKRIPPLVFLDAKSKRLEAIFASLENPMETIIFKSKE